MFSCIGLLLADIIHVSDKIELTTVVGGTWLYCSGGACCVPYTSTARVMDLPARRVTASVPDNEADKLLTAQAKGGAVGGDGRHYDPRRSSRALAPSPAAAAICH